MKDLKLAESEHRFMKIVWENQPLSGTQLVKLCADSLGWKKSTTYTVLKRLSEKGVVENRNSTIVPLVSRKEVGIYESENVIARSFDGSLTGFVAAFMEGKKLSKDDANRLRAMIEDWEE
ncbi:MAG: BlaI/MecI/CopY family transcriptional regulator [Oscillospiraceae bacterium]|nr:BlaI/MecI/CopY family transcriptional regulator [Oscillospiraceae bacterium]